MKHLTKLFDSMAKLKFELDSSGQPIKSAIAMYSKDGEYVDLEKPCDLNGQVWTKQLHTLVVVTDYWALFMECFWCRAPQIITYTVFSHQQLSPVQGVVLLSRTWIVSPHCIYSHIIFLLENKLNVSVSTSLLIYLKLTFTCEHWNIIRCGTPMIPSHA